MVVVMIKQNPITETANTISGGISEFLTSLLFGSLYRPTLIYEPPVLINRRKTGWDCCCGMGMGIGVGGSVAICRSTFACETALNPIAGMGTGVG